MKHKQGIYQIRIIILYFVFELFCRKYAFNQSRLKPAFFQVLCEIKEKTGLLKYIILKEKVNFMNAFF